MFFRRHPKIAIVATCSDWRLHHRRVNLDRRVARLLHVDAIDVLAVPGPDGLLRDDRGTEWKTLVGQAMLLIGAHKPESLAIVAHQRCAGHPVDNDAHEKDVVAMATALKNETGFHGPVAAVVAVFKSDARWELKRVASL